MALHVASVAHDNDNTTMYSWLASFGTDPKLPIDFQLYATYIKFKWYFDLANGFWTKNLEKKEAKSRRKKGCMNCENCARLDKLCMDYFRP